MVANPHPSHNLLAGRRALEGLPNFELLDDLAWYPTEGVWLISCRLKTSDSPSILVPELSEWYVQLADSYPFGKLRFYPSKKNSLSKTFPHQAYNGEGEPNNPWRDGRLCLTTQLASLQRQGFRQEPFDADNRLRWNAERALLWLKLASRNKLRCTGDPFELPSYPEASKKRLAFCETAESLKFWENSPPACGYAQLWALPDVPAQLIIKAFEDSKGKVVKNASWGSWLRGNASEAPPAAWILLPRIPVLEPWQAPASWRELLEQLAGQGGDLRQQLRSLADRLRDSQPHLLLLGFAIPERIGDPKPRRLHWLALQLPVLATGNQVRQGFRQGGESGHWAYDRMQMQGDTPLLWLPSECWSAKELGGRGRLIAPLRKRRVVVLGAGALGSSLAEMLLRGGVHSLAVIDADSMQAGNLVRHTLAVRDLHKNKALSLASRLNELSPFAQVTAIEASFPILSEEGLETCRKADLVIDCTASEEMPFNLESFDWPQHPTIACLSLGIRARRLYCYIVKDAGFQASAYWDALSPHLRQDLESQAGRPLPREGVGCWNPVFPARSDEVWVLAGAAVQVLAQALADDSMGRRLSILEQQEEEGEFSGITRSDE